MNTTWRKTEAGETVFEGHAPLGARLIIGAMLSFFALFFLYYLFSGLGEYIRGATASEWLGALPGFLVVLFLFLLFAVPAWAVFFGRSRVIIDPAGGRIVDMFDLLIYKRVKTSRAEEAKDIIFPCQESAKRMPTHVVQIRMRDGRLIKVGYEVEAREAREVAEQLSGALRVPVAESPRQSDED